MTDVERGRRVGIAFGHPLSGGYSSTSSSYSPSSVSPPPTKTLVSLHVGSIEHRVSKMDTLAGIAIKYGVEVADIKRMNSLVTDLQMFAHKNLQIPLPGRHPPSRNLPEDSPENGVHGAPCKDDDDDDDLGDLLQLFPSVTLKPPQPPRRRLSTAMSTLQGYYGLKSNAAAGEGTEMAVYRNNKGLVDMEDHVSLLSSPGRHRKSKSINGFVSENGGVAEDDIMYADGDDSLDADRSYSEKSVRRRQRADADPSCYPPHSSLKVENGGVLTGKTVKNTTTTTSPRKAPGSEVDLQQASGNNNVPVGDVFMSSGFFSVRKSSSTPDLQESDGPFLWPTTKWTFNAHAMTRPLFDGFPMNIAPRRKTALD